MITYCASDIIRHAKTVGCVSNVNMSNFDLSTTLLNTEYQRLYDRIVSANGANIIEVAVDTTEPWTIPEDCYHIIGIYAASGSSRTKLEKNSIRQYIKGRYRIENNKVCFDGIGAASVIIVYSSLPQTITAPDEPELLSFIPATVGKVGDKGFYYKDSSGTSYYYTFSTEESSTATFKEQSSKFLDHTLTLTDGVVYYNGTDVTSLFARDDVTISSLVVSNPYAIVNYSDRLSFIFKGFEGGDQLNYYQPKGKETYGEVLGFCTNDITGKGCIWKSDDDNEVYYTSFTPDTVLNYPSNTFFQLLIYRLAAALTSMNGVTNQYLTDVQIPEAEVAFTEHLERDNNTPIRMNND